MCEICQNNHDTLDCPDYPIGPCELAARDEHKRVWFYVAQNQGDAYRAKGATLAQAQSDEIRDDRPGGRVYHQSQLAYSHHRGWYLPAH